MHFSVSMQPTRASVDCLQGLCNTLDEQSYEDSLQAWTMSTLVYRARHPDDYHTTLPENDLKCII